MAFSKTRNVELSLIKYVTDQVNANWTGVRVVKSFLEMYDSTRPVICVRMLSVDTHRWEIGGSLKKQTYTFIIDIFANSDGQRIDLEDFIVGIVNADCPYYTFTKDPSNAENLIATQNGYVTLTRFVSDMRITADDNEHIEDKFRQSITFTMCKYDTGLN